MSQDKSPLEDILQAIIETDGPVGMDRFMALCLAHPEHGYYRSRTPFGRSGDFTTAPEVSQIFGELMGIWCVSGWQMMQAPDPVHLVELGPGRGTMMADMLRAGGVMPGFLESVRVHLIETSPALRKVQQETLQKFDGRVEITWRDHLDEVAAGPMLLVANEFFDALPISQFEKRNGRWFERLIGLQGGSLAVGLSQAALAEALVPEWALEAEDGAIIEVSPAREAYAKLIASRIAAHEGAALIIDYGHIHSGVGDTLQAVRNHRFADVLERPGESDLTSHVDFGQLAAALSCTGVEVHGPLTQTQFLFGMGLGERAEVLRKRAGARERIRMKQAVERLVAAKEMGHLFKTLAVAHPKIGKPAPFGQPFQGGSHD